MARPNNTPIGAPSTDEPLFAAKKFCLKLLGIRARTKHELIARLKEKNYPDDVITTAVRDLSSVGLIDDNAFARHWIARQLENNCGKTRIIFKLREKGIAENIINAEIESGVANYDESAAAYAEAKKFTNVYKNLKPETLTRRIAEHLTRKGFSEDIVKNILNHYDHE